MIDPSDDPCEKCEEVMQPYLDRVLSEDETARGRGASRRVLLLPAALPVRGEPAASTCARS